MDIKEVVSIANKLTQREEKSLANDVLEAFTSVTAQPKNPGDIDQEQEDHFTVEYPDYTVRFEEKNGEPAAILVKDGEDTDGVSGHEEVFEFMGDYVHPADRGQLWSLFGDKFNIESE